MTFWQLVVFAFLGVCHVAQPKFQPPKIVWKGVETTTTYTPSDYGYKHLWVTVEERSSLTFQVRACSDAHVALSMFDDAVSDFTTEIIIGGWHNSRSQIRNLFSAGSWFEAITPKILHCNEYRYFWVSWANNYVEVGRGPTVGVQKFMNYQFRNLHKISAVGFSNGYGYTGTWKVVTNSGNTLIQNTPTDNKYQYMWRTAVEREYIPFAVKACENARIVLSETEGNTRFNTWEVVIGGASNKKTFIKSSPLSPDPQNQQSATPATQTVAQTPDILSCEESRLFWVGWAGGNVQVGRGMYFGQQVLATLDDRNNSHAVNALSVASGSGDGRWEFNDNMVGSTTVLTPPGKRYKPLWIESLRSKFITFYVRACSDAGIILSAQKFVQDDWALKVVLGAESNTVSGIQGVINVGWRYKTNTPKILSCDDSKAFWVSWENSTIRVGRGSFYDMRTVLFSFDAWKEHPIGAASFVTDNQVTGEWTVSKNIGETMTFVTDKDGGQNYNQVWRSVENQKMVAFTLKACSDAHILLSKTQGKTDGDIYEIVIGGWGNSRTAVRRRIAGPLVRAESTQNILNCSEPRPLWFAWVNGNIKIGRGFFFNRNKVLDWRDPNPIPVTAMALSTGYGHAGEWQFEEFLGEKAVFYTPNLLSYGTKFITVSPTVTALQFDVRACNDARIKLQDDSNPSSFYVITVGGQGNTMLMISKSNEIKNQKAISDLLACQTTRSFWVSWKSGNILIGRGKVAGIHPLVGYSDFNSPVKVQSARFSTGIGSDGHWVINEDAGRTLTYDTPQQWTNYKNRLWITSKEREYATFSVQACSEVFILLSTMFGSPSRYAYEVVIGGWKGRRSVIRQRGWDGGDHHSETSEPLLSCSEMRPFWVSWAGGRIELGKGNLRGLNRVMDWLDMSPHRVLALGFTTGYGVSGMWKLNIAKDLEPTDPPVTEQPAPTARPTEKQKPNRGPSPGATAGIVIGVLICVAILGVVVLLIVKPAARGKALDAARSVGQKARSFRQSN